MTMTQKFAGLSAEQKELFKAVKNVGTLEAFLTENSIDLTVGEKNAAIAYQWRKLQGI